MTEERFQRIKDLARPIATYTPGWALDEAIKEIELLRRQLADSQKAIKLAAKGRK